MPNSNIRINSITEKDTNQSVEVSKLAPIGAAGGAVIYVDTVADLQALDTSGLVEGQSASVQGSEFRWDGSEWIPVSHVTPRAFGAVPGQVSTPEVQDWLDNGGDRLVLDDEYHVNGPIEINRENVTIQGFGKGAIIQQDPDEHAITASHKNRLRFQGVRFVSEDTRSVARFYLCSDMVFDKCRIENKNPQTVHVNVAGIGFSTEEGQYSSMENITIRDCYFRVANKPVIFQASESFGPFKNVFISGNTFDFDFQRSDVINDGVKIDGNGRDDNRNIIITDNIFKLTENTSAIGSMLQVEEGVYETVISNNIFHGPGTAQCAIRVFHGQKETTVNQISVHGNLISEITATVGAIDIGVDAEFANCSIQGNTIKGVSGKAFSYWSSSRDDAGALSVIGNIIDGVDFPSDDAIFIRNNDSFVFSGNIIKNTSGIMRVRNCNGYLISNNSVEGQFSIIASLDATGQFTGNKIYSKGSGTAIVALGASHVSDNIIYGERNHAVVFDGATEGVARVVNNDLDSSGATINAFGGFSDWARIIVRGNLGFKTRDQGVSEVVHLGSTGHGLDRRSAPGRAAVAFANSLTGRVANVSGTSSNTLSFTLKTIDNNDVTSPEEVMWTIVSGLELDP